MLNGYPIVATIAVSDLGNARRFYEQTLGFTPDEEQPDGVSYRSGGSRFFIYPSQFAGTGQQTVASWEVDDLDAEAEGLRRQGITFEQYDLADLKTDERGIAEMGGVRGFWFKDPDGNILSVAERASG
jgi:catechol 2,3-dioxygenase-like lactoylglutathione lyase family enzyme